MIGQTVSHYKVLEQLGRGGMGEVYGAEDLKLKRAVALKFLPSDLTRDHEANARFIYEAQTASALDHQNVCNIHEIDEDDEGRTFICMAYYEGKTLKERLARGPLSIEEALDLTIQVAQGLAKVHAKCIIHRDLKPSNLFITTDGVVKILDFGLAKLTYREQLTKEGTTLGTVAYISPEQAAGKTVDHRSDLWSLGVVLYEMLSGERPFKGEIDQAVIYAIMNEEPVPLTTLRSDVPAAVARLVNRALEKHPDKRVSSAKELLELLNEAYPAQQRSEPSRRNAFVTRFRQPRYTVPAVLVVVALLALSVLTFKHYANVSWARYEAPAQVENLLRELKYVEAFLMARNANTYLPDDPQVDKMLQATSFPCSVRTNPPGADIFFKDYSAVDAEWQYLGQTPLDSTRLPSRYLRIRVTKSGYVMMENAVNMWLANTLQFTLIKSDSTQDGMVFIPSGWHQVGSNQPVELPAYWLDKYEVTNSQFQEFVDAGAYHNPEHWKHPFVKDGDTLTFEQAMHLFRDATGQPGPSTWKLGTYPEGMEDYPVGGVSWYEAAAYAKFIGKSLPTIYHWRRAAGFTSYSDILVLSNFENQGPAAVGAYNGLSGYGCYDLAGNVKEWCLNGASGRRYISGGGWNEPEYMYSEKDIAAPFAREKTFGLRCAKYLEPLATILTQPIDALYHDFNLEKPVSDDIFAIYEGLYSYDKLELDARIDAVDESSAHWRKETVSFDAGYGEERMIAHLYLPRNTKPPYQAVVYFPGGGALMLTTSQDPAELAYIDFIARSGRALVYPVYKGTYERGGGTRPAGPRTGRDWRILRGKDVRRSVDYLQTRDDIDSGKIAYFGLSWGAAEGPIFTAIESRFKASVLLAGGLSYWRMRREPETNPLHFASRVQVPTLMINGRFDPFFPPATSSGPLFRLLGASEPDKRHALFNSGHFPAHIDIIRETLDWLDRYLGPVEKDAS